MAKTITGMLVGLILIIFGTLAITIGYYYEYRDLFIIITISGLLIFLNILIKRYENL